MGRTINIYRYMTKNLLYEAPTARVIEFRFNDAILTMSGFNSSNNTEEMIIDGDIFTF